MEEQDSISEDIKGEEKEASPVQGFLTIVLDMIIETGLIVLIYFLFPKEIINYLFEISPYSKYIIVLLIFFLYRFITILIFGKTIGMMITATKYLNRDQLPLT